MIEETLARIADALEGIREAIAKDAAPAEVKKKSTKKGTKKKEEANDPVAGGGEVPPSILDEAATAVDAEPVPAAEDVLKEGQRVLGLLGNNAQPFVKFIQDELCAKLCEPNGPQKLIEVPEASRLEAITMIKQWEADNISGAGSPL